jgi:SOS response regulatory protein OraA/RecX
MFVSNVIVQSRRLRVAELEAALKRQMLERGMSAAEIEQVLRASNQRGESRFDGSPATAKEVLVRMLTGHRSSGYQYSGQEIERVLRAFGQHAGPEDGANASAYKRALASKLTIVRKLAEQGTSVDEIEAVLRTYTEDARWRVDALTPQTGLPA